MAMTSPSMHEVIVEVRPDMSESEAGAPLTTAQASSPLNSSAPYSGEAIHIGSEDLIIDLRSIVSNFNLPSAVFCVFVLAFISEYVVGILSSMVAFLMFKRLQKTISAFRYQDSGNLVALCLLGACSIMCIVGVVLFPVENYEPLISTMLLRVPQHPLSFADCVWRIIMIDIIHRLLLQSLTAFSLAKKTTIHQRHQIMHVSAGLSVLHRCAVPVPLWFVWLRNTSTPLNIFLSWSYLYLRTLIFFSKLPLFMAYIKSLLSSRSAYGEYVNVADTDADAVCAICFDCYRSPIRLPCSHLYCEECISEWLERETTCPMCRSTLRSNDRENLLGVGGFYGPFQIA